MAEPNTLSDAELADLVIISERGTRNKTHGASKIVITCTALLWSLFQLWIASPLPYVHFIKDVLEIPVLSSISARYVHLSFAMLLVFLTYPAGTSSSRKNIPITDWLFAIASVFCCMILYFMRGELSKRTGVPITFDIVVSMVGILLLLEATRRALGKALVIISVIFLAYAYIGNGWYIPDIIATKAHSLKSIASNQWLSTEGVFGISIGVSAEFVFLFVLFGALLEKSGAGNYFIQLAFSLLGHMRGGPAKAAVLASAFTGTIAGSSIANVVTTGTFTIPLMRRVGYSREKAGAIEVSAGVDGQLMPPVMGTAAFLIAEYIGISYVEVVKAAFLPAILSYMALLYIVHLEAVKANMRIIPKAHNKTAKTAVIHFGITVSSILIVSGLVYYVISWVKSIGGDFSPYFIAAIALASYICLLKYSSKFPPLVMDDPNKEIVELPRTFPTFISGLHFLLPLVVLVWCLVIEEMTPAASVLWAMCLIMFMLVTQNPLKEFFQNGSSAKVKTLLKSGGVDLFYGLTTGARNMLGVSIATAAAGIIVGAITLTGIGQVMTELVELVSGGSFILMLMFTAIICLILGTGLPTTATYIVVASLMAPVIRELGMKAGMDIPLVAIHLFVFYFGIMADVTPPVGLASFAAAAISGGDPIKTGIQGTIYNFRTAILPFIFMYNNEVLLIGITSIAQGIFVVVKCTIATLLFAAATQGFFIARSKIHETVLLLLVVFALFRPGYFIDIYSPPYLEGDIKNLEEIVKDAEVGQIVKFKVTGVDMMGEAKHFVARIPIHEGKTAKERLKKYGIVLDRDGNKIMVSNVTLGSEAKKRGFDVDYAITGVEVPNKQLSRNWVIGAALLALGFVVASQKKRNNMIISLSQPVNAD
jgi:TRAP transporter 4TM/12TM fusion protein